MYSITQPGNQYAGLIHASQDHITEHIVNSQNIIQTHSQQKVLQQTILHTAHTIDSKYKF